MNILLKRRAILIAAASVLIAIVTIISVNLFNTTGPVTGLVNVISNPLRALASTVAGTFEGIYNSVYSYDRLKIQYEAAKEYIAELERNERESVALAEENEQLRTKLGFRERHAQYIDEAADVIDWSSSNWVSSFTINRGYANSSIKEGNAVVTEYGVVIGQISSVDATQATVKTVLDTSFNLSVNIGETEGVTTLRGDFDLLHAGFMMLDFIDDDMDIAVGDRVATSGIGGVFPPGLIVGQIYEIHPHENGIGRYAAVLPIRDINSTILKVFVIIEFGEAGLDVY